MKKLALISAACLSCASLTAAPLFTIGDQVDVFFRGALIGKWDSNVYSRAENKIDDYSMIIRLGVEANYGRDSRFKASVRFHEDLVRYLKETNANSDLANLFTNASYTEERWAVNANFSFQQVAQNTSTMAVVPDDILVRRDIYKAGINGRYDFTDKLNGELGFTWYREHFRDNMSQINPGTGKREWEYSDRDTYAVPVSILYRITDKVNAGLTYQYRHTEYSKGNPGSNDMYGNSVDDHFVGVTVRGTLLPKLTSEIFIGYTFRDLPGANFGEGDSEGTFSFTGNFEYAVTDKLSSFVEAFRDFGNGASRQSSINTGVRVGANYAFSEFIGGRASFGYTNSDYSMSIREDDWFSFSAKLNYTPNKYISLSAGYSYYDNSSNVRSYMQHIVDISFAVRY